MGDFDHIYIFYISHISYNEEKKNQGGKKYLCKMWDDETK